MCGIAGFVNFAEQMPNPEVVAQMTRILAHRGPDGQGVEIIGAAGLGHRRLSIVDLSDNGRQPMSNEDGSVWIVFNGEIYNHADLRADLLAKGHIFQSHTDTEAIIHGYEEYGFEVVHRLNGMFAFAIWDNHQKQVWLVRDRIGIKPLFYAQFGEVLLFGSEIKALLQHPACRRELNTEALDLYLSLNYTPAPETLFKGIHQLEPAQWLIAQNSTVKLHTYWDVDYSQRWTGTEAQALEEFEALFHQAVKRRLMADVPLGAFLSGGVDSSAVVASMRRCGGVKTFSMGFGEKSFNEAPFAKLVADHLHTEHYEKIVTPDLAGILPKVVWHGEDPLADSSMIPVYYLAQMTREHVTVALAGDGADEILAGYPTYPATQLAGKLAFLPHQALQAVLQPLLNRFPSSDEKLSWREKLGRFSAGVGLPWQEAHAVWRQIHRPAQKQAIFSLANGHNRLFERYYQHYARSRSDNQLDALLYVDTRFYLPNDMLVKVDRMTMAHSLEGRVPFLDHELVQFAASLPPHFKLNNGTGKYILRQVMAKYLPSTTLTRRKEGFNIPVAKWLRGELRELLTDTLTPTRLQDVGVWQPPAIQAMIQAHLSRQQDNGHQLWGLLTFMLWWEQFMREAV